VRVSGCTVHFVTPELDSGPIIAQAAVPVLTCDTPETLAERILAAEHKLYPFALQLVSSGAARLIDGRVVLKEGVNQGNFLYSPMA
jgi:folate-dependent phosphoribosylglycinamide formyltransferase PurN